MQFSEFSNIMSTARMAKYVTACNGSTKKAMTLYRLNLRLSQELFTIISCFEVSLRNVIDKHYTNQFGNDWLRDSASVGGIFDTPRCRVTKSIINSAFLQLQQHNAYTHNKLLAERDFGFWRYLFAQPQYFAAGQTLLHVFPAKPRSTAAINYNQTFVFNQLGDINDLRNRIAHHEPICFVTSAGTTTKNTIYARQHYNLLLQLFQWMQIDERSLLYGLDHINTVCSQIDVL